MSKTDWKPEDFEGCGHYLVRSEENHIQRTGYLSTIMVKVVYVINPERLYGLTSMADGWTRFGVIKGTESASRFCPFKTKQDLCDDLNSSKKGQRYRPATQEEVIRVILLQKKRCFNE